jgi:tRNA threonylcarbamoyladenosine biosynthesis protein TsaE
MKKVYFTKSPASTKSLAKKIAKEIIKEKKGSAPFVLGLEGDLGGGKTTFLQGFAIGLGVVEKILSPTFVIMRKFKIPIKKNRHFKNFYHLDCYRAENSSEVCVLGLKKIISDPENIVAIEWAEKIRKDLPKKIIWINFKFVDDKKRKIIISK